jgi:GTP-binding protein
VIERAHEGARLGDRFLGHIERCGVLLHLVDGTDDDVAENYRTVRAELAAYGFGLEDKAEILALNKCDALQDDELEEKRAALEREAGHPVVILSGVTGLGRDQVLRMLIDSIHNWREGAADPARALEH